jgi:hypothetical protein
MTNCELRSQSFHITDVSTLQLIVEKQKIKKEGLHKGSTT